MEIRLADIKDLDKVIEFYIEVSSNKNNKARWHYGLYPTDEDINNAINSKELYILLEDNKIISAAILRMQEDEIYKDTNWNNNNPAVVHLLATSFSKQHQGYGKKLLQYLIKIAKTHNKESIHLDIVFDNDDARKLYESLGFVCIENKKLYYPDTGLMYSSLFELLI